MLGGGFFFLLFGSWLLLAELAASATGGAAGAVGVEIYQAVDTRVGWLFVRRKFLKMVVALTQRILHQNAKCRFVAEDMDAVIAVAVALLMVVPTGNAPTPLARGAAGAITFVRPLQLEITMRAMKLLLVQFRATRRASLKFGFHGCLLLVTPRGRWFLGGNKKVWS